MEELQRPASCSIARAMEVLGEGWTFLILRECFYGVRRFSDMHRNLGIARNILSTRLHSLVAAGVLERVPYQEDPPRFEYRLTEAGRDLYPSIIALMRWGTVTWWASVRSCCTTTSAATRRSRCWCARTV